MIQRCKRRWPTYIGVICDVPSFGYRPKEIKMVWLYHQKDDIEKHPLQIMSRRHLGIEYLFFFYDPWTTKFLNIGTLYSEKPKSKALRFIHESNIFR